jgi:GAF domain-containing protein
VVDIEPYVERDAATEIGAAAALMDELAGTLTAMDDLPDYLDRVCRSVSRSVPGCDAVGVTVVLDDRPHTAAYTTASTLEIDAVQYAVGDGPCLDAFRNRRENLVDLATALDRWPLFAAEAARDDGIRSLFALPLVSGGQALGALNLYAYAPGAFDGIELTLVRMAASRAADAIASVVLLVGARALAEQLETALASRAVIEQAKGIIMGRQGVDEGTAFDLLRQQSQHTNTKLREVAAALVATAVKGDRRAG